MRKDHTQDHDEKEAVGGPRLVVQSSGAQNVWSQPQVILAGQELLPPWQISGQARCQTVQLR